MSKKIAIYQTDENGARLFSDAMRDAVKTRRLSDDVEVITMTGDEIRNGHLYKHDVMGLIMPGRNKGQDYRDELTQRGCRNIFGAVHDTGLPVLAVCAGSYVLSEEVMWDNSQHDPADKKTVSNNTALFQGMAIGPFHQIWNNGYRGRHENKFISNSLQARVVDISFNKNLLNQNEIKNGFAVYWGGGHYQSTSCDQDITVLASHQGTERFETNLQTKPNAVIEFQRGMGAVIFSNIHPEISPETFRSLFRLTPKAKADRKEFESDVQKLASSESLYGMIFTRFLDNCLSGVRGLAKAQKLVAKPAMAS